MRRRRPRGETVAPLPRLAPDLTRPEWLAAMRRQWADAHVPGSDRWATAHAALDEIEAFELSGEESTALILSVASTGSDAWTRLSDSG